jgi:hypothetical protein
MDILADMRIPGEALEALTSFGNVVPFSTSCITYESVACHPDIFIFNAGKNSIVAPNLPETILSRIVSSGVPVSHGETPVGSKYPESAVYNAVITEYFLIHNFRITDPVINSAAGDREMIHVSQGYTRCTTLPLKENHFITSDEGIFRTLKRYGLYVIYFKPANIILPGAKHGFFGGACSIFEDRVMINGNLNHLGEGDEVRKLLTDLKYDVIELYDGPLFDSGTLVFLP